MFNAQRQLLGKQAALGDHEQFVMAIGSGDYEWVDCLVAMGLKQRAGINALQNLSERAASGAWEGRTYTEKDMFHQLWNWCMGGIQLAEIAHQNANLPSMSTIWRHSTMLPLLPSPSYPLLSEVLHNFNSCFSRIVNIIEAEKAVHQVLMFDEIATEQRL